MASNDGDQQNPNEASVSPSSHQENNVLLDKDFTENLLYFFRNGLKDSLDRTKIDLLELVRRSWNIFKSHFKVVRHEEIYVEILFSVFELVHSKEYTLIRNALKIFLRRKIHKYFFVRSELTRNLARIASKVRVIHYYIDPFLKEMSTVDNYCSPALLLDFTAMKRLIRYGAQFKMNPLQTECCLKSILVAVT